MQRVGRQCFVRAVHATGYVVPRETAVVMFNAPEFKITEVLSRPGDSVADGAVMARATSARGGTTPVEIHAMAAGLVLGSTAFVGKPTSVQGEPLFTLAVDGDMEVAVDVPGTHVFEVKAGQVAHVGMRDGTVLEGHVRLAPPIIDRATQMGQARLAFDAGPARPMIGRFIRATIEAERSCGIGVPQAAVIEASTGPRLQVVERGVVVTKAVQLGLAGDSDVEVTAGLHEGDLIVANAGASLHDGDRVTPVAANGQDSP
jgi:predicted deacylase